MVDTLRVPPVLSKGTDDFHLAANEHDISKYRVLTTDVIENKGAYGAPWLWLTNSEGKSEPVFGSDRWQYVYDFLGVKYRDIEIAPSNGGSKL